MSDLTGDDVDDLFDGYDPRDDPDHPDFEPVLPHRAGHVESSRAGTGGRKRWATVAICEMHWTEEEGDRVPIRMRLDPDADSERCYRCNHPLSMDVIYVRREIDT